MEDPALASPERIEQLLELACAYNAPLALQAELDEQIYRYKSRMLDVTGEADSKSVIIDQPVSDGPVATLRPGYDITLFFALEQGRYAFDARILKRTEYELGNHKKTQALEIAYPNALKSGQRRSYYRVTVPVRRPIHVDCIVISEIDLRADGDGASRASRHKGQMHARSIDVSAGGLLVAFESGDIGLAEVGTRLVLEFTLTPGEAPLKLKAVIRRIMRKSAAEQLRAGLEFIDVDEAVESKLAVNRLYKYVAEIQREILQTGLKED